MAIRFRRSDRRAMFYRPVGKGFYTAAALQARGWEVVRCEKWNSEDELLVIKVPKARSDAEFIADMEAIHPDEDVDGYLEDYYFTGED